MAIVSGLKGVCFLFLTLAFLGISNAQNDTGAYVGCYEDTEERNANSDLYQNKPTPDDCREYCRGISHTFAELLNGNQCKCTNWSTSDKTGKLDDSKCNVPCTEEPSKRCGGNSTSNAFSVYTSCPKGKFGIKNCTQNCNCKDNEQCQIVTGVCPGNECAPGWNLDNRKWCSIDVDECKRECSSTDNTNCHNCNATNGEICNNTVGSFRCICRSEFINKNGKCTAISQATAFRAGIGIVLLTSICIILA